MGRAGRGGVGVGKERKGLVYYNIIIIVLGRRRVVLRK